MQSEILNAAAYRNHHDIPLQEDLVSVRSGGAVGSLSNDLEQTQRI